MNQATTTLYDRLGGLDGITRITLQARADNTAAIRLYEAVGFQHEARVRNAMRLAEVSVRFDMGISAFLR